MNVLTLLRASVSLGGETDAVLCVPCCDDEVMMISLCKMTNEGKEDFSQSETVCDNIGMWCEEVVVESVSSVCVTVRVEENVLV